MAEKDKDLLGEDGPVEDEPVEEPTRRRRFPIKSLIAIVIIVLVALPLISMLQPKYYERYPSLHGRMENWRVSTHARIPCSGCHIEPGPLGLAKFAAKSIPAFYAQLAVGPKPNNVFAVPTRQACQKCHTSYRQVSTNGDLLIPHRAHVEVLGLSCSTCHTSLVHTSNDQGFNKPEMAMCLKKCHDGVKATNECTKCHTRKHVPDSHKAANWLEVHSTKTETGECASCHGWTPDFCDECHSRKPASHAGNWKKDHQFRVEKRGDKGCLVCHDDGKFCEECHD